MKVSNLFPSKFLRGADIAGTPTYTISSIEEEEVGQDREKKHVVYFANQQKGVVLNKTNCDTLTVLYGDETDEWIGEEVTLFTTPVTFNGKTTDAIRFRAPKRVKAAKEAAEIANALDDEVPY
jgi:hypothetical protein